MGPPCYEGGEVFLRSQLSVSAAGRGLCGDLLAVAEQGILETCLCCLLLYLKVEIQLHVFLVDNFPNLDFFSKITQKLNWSVFFYSFVFVYAPKMAIGKNFIFFQYQGKFRTLIK